MNFTQIEHTLATGAIEPRGQFLYGSNYTVLVAVSDERNSYNAVYKPTKGERPLWDFPDGTLAAREAAAYRLSQHLGLDLVPPTVLRSDGPFGAGSAQLLIPHDPERHYFNLPDDQLPRLLPVAFFDLLCNNADRKGSHILFSREDDHLFAIDHGLCFNQEDKLRTVIWNFAGQPIPEDLLERLRQAIDPSNAQTLRQALRGLLNPTEIDALFQRARDLLQNPRFPSHPVDKRATPFPPL